MIYLQCLVRKAKELGLCLHRYNEKNNPDGHKILTNLIKLALFKSDLVEKTVQVIEKRVEAVYAASKSREAELLGWRLYISDYIRAYWMEKVGPESFVVYKQVDRTNNPAETNNNQTKAKLHTRPGADTYSCKLSS